ncbi:MAG TPA: GNAT family N-acetyltransferase [Trebonia sp.]|nr:GNAT family N-acetyltransferase [Trebonia sp.]
MTVTIRMARAGDVPALAGLRRANGQRHAALDPAGHRVPGEDQVRRHFEELLSGRGPAGVVVLVAEVAGAVAGMTELVIRPEPPGHQVLVPRPEAQVHTVVLDAYRGQGIGSALVAAAERHAAGLGVSRLVAPILAANAEAIGFYSGAGFGSHGVILAKDLTAGPGGE